ncbi:unnamed protein product [Closterium sp. NIES-54]
MLLCPKGDPDALDIPTPHSYVEVIAGEYSSQWQTAMDAEMASWKSTGTYIDEVPPPGANIVDGMWIFRVMQPPGSPLAFKTACSRLQSAIGGRLLPDLLPHPEDDTLQVLLYVAAQRDYELHSLYFSTPFLQGSMHEEIWLRRPPGFTGSFPADPSPHRLPVLLITAHSSVYRPLAFSSTFGRVRRAEWSVPRACYCLMYLMTCTRPDLAYPLSLVARYVAPGRHRKVHWDAAKRVLRYLCSSSGMGLVLGGWGSVVLTGHSDASWANDQATQRFREAEIYAGAMAAQELRWLTYLLTDLGERPRFPPVLYVDNKPMLALCHEQRLEHRTKHIALRYFLARELQQRRPLRLSYGLAGQHC